MAKEQVNIVFSADSAQARKLFEEMANGLDKVGKKVQQQSKQMESFGGSMVKMAVSYGVVSKASQLFSQLLDQETQALGRRADAFEKLQTGFDKMRAEGGLTAGQAGMLKGAIGSATQMAAVDAGTATSVAQQMLEDKFSAGDIAGGGLNAMLKGIVAVNARGEGGDPKQLAKQFANIMQTLGRSPTTGNVESTVADLHGLMNATGLDMGGAEGLITSMSRASKPRMAKALKSVGLTPGQIDPNTLGIGAAGQNLANAIAGMGDSEQSAFLSRVLGDEGATAFMRGRSEFRSGAVRSGAADVERDFRIGTTGTMADLRRDRAAREMDLANRGELDAQYRDALAARDQRFSQGGLVDRALNVFRPIMDPALAAVVGDKFKRDTIDTERKMRIELTTPNGSRVDGRTRGTKNLNGLNN